MLALVTTAAQASFCFTPLWHFAPGWCIISFNKELSGLRGIQMLLNDSQKAKATINALHGFYRFHINSCHRTANPSSFVAFISQQRWLNTNGCATQLISYKSFFHIGLTKVTKVVNFNGILQNVANLNAGDQALK